MNVRRRFALFLLTGALGLGLAVAVMTLAAQTSAVKAEPVAAPHMAPSAVDLEVNKEGPDPPDTLVNRPVTYTLYITNHLDTPISNVVITDTWLVKIRGAVLGTPPHFDGSYVADPPDLVSSFIYTPLTEGDLVGTVLWDLINPLPANFQGQIQFTLWVSDDLQPLYVEREDKIVGPSDINNSAEIGGDGVTANEADTVVTLIKGPVLTLTKSFTSEVGVRPGRLLTFTLHLRNLSTEERSDSAPATGLVVVEALPSELVYQGAWAEAPLAPDSPTYDPDEDIITWMLAPTFTLYPGEMTTLTFAARLQMDQDWEKTVSNRNTKFWVTAAELGRPVEGWETLSFKTEAAATKTYVTEPETEWYRSSYVPLESGKTYPNHLITYTVHVFNPLSQSVASNLRITDAMPATWRYVRTVDGPEPVTPDPITNTVAWEWPGEAIEADGVMSFTFAARVGPDTPVDGGSCKETYYNSLAISADEFPLVYQYGEAFGDSRGMAELDVGEQVMLSKEVDPTKQFPGGLVTYTVHLHNQGNRAVHSILYTDTLPPDFRYHSMLEGAAEPIKELTNTLVWSIDQIDKQTDYTFRYRAIVNGPWGDRPGSDLKGYSLETTFCTQTNKARVEILSPIEYEKSATPALDSGEWVVQGEAFEYTVQFWNRSPLFDYEASAFWDQLPIVKLEGGTRVDYGGFDVNGETDYVYTISPTALLLADHGSDWPHTFAVTATGEGVVTTTGEGVDTNWCNTLMIQEDAYSGKFGEQEIYQFGSTRYGGTFGLLVTGEDPTVNGTKQSPIWLKPHVDLFQDVYPKTAGFGSTVTVTLTLRNNMRGARTRSVDPITLTYQMPEDFVFRGVITPLNPPVIEGLGGQLVWYGLDLPAGEGQERLVQFLLEAPFEKKTSTKGVATVMLQDEDICIPASEAKALVALGVEISKLPHEQIIGPYGVVEYTLQLVNKTSAPVTRIVLTDTLPLGFEFIEMVPGQGPVPDEVVGRQIIWRGLQIAAAKEDDDTLTMRYKARVPGLVGVYYNEVDGLSATTYFTYYKGVEKYLENVAVVVAAGVGMRKIVTPTHTLAGETVTYTLFVENISDKRVAGIRVTDTLPAGFSFQDMLTGPVPIMTTPQVVWALSGELLAYQKAELTFVATVDPELRSGVYYNNASATAHESGNPDARVSIPDTDKTAPVTVQALPNVRRSKTVQPSRVQAGSLVTYTVTLLNDTDTAQTVRLTDTLPLSLTYHSVVDGTPAPVRTSPVAWEGINMAVSETLTLTFRAQVDLYARSGTYYNRLDAATADLALSPRENLAPLQVDEIPRYDLQVSKIDGKIKVDPGDILRYTIAYTNANTAGLTLQNVLITDTFSPAPPHANPRGVSQDWTAVTPEMWTHFVGDLAPGASGSLAFTLELASSIPQEIMVVSNTARIGHATDALAFESDPANNVDTDLNTLHGPDLIVTGVTFEPASPQVGQPIQFAVTVRNQGDDPTINAAGDAWFPVELYLKGSDFVPSGPPSDVFDHAGGYCADAGCSETRPEYMIYAAGLAGDGAETTLSFIVILTQVDDYALYAQVDSSFAGAGIGEPWGHDYGTVPEALEDNNIYTYSGLVQVGESTGVGLYLPLVLKAR